MNQVVVCDFSGFASLTGRLFRSETFKPITSSQTATRNRKTSRSRVARWLLEREKSFGGKMRGTWNHLVITRKLKRYEWKCNKREECSLWLRIFLSWIRKLTWQKANRFNRSSNFAQMIEPPAWSWGRIFDSRIRRLALICVHWCAMHRERSHPFS